MSDISNFDDDSFTKGTRRRRYSISNESPSDTNESKFNMKYYLNFIIHYFIDIASCLSPEENLFSSELHFIPENTPDPIELRTESRIKIVPKINHQNQFFSKDFLLIYNRKKFYCYR